MSSVLVLNLRNLSRKYYDLVNNRFTYISKLQDELLMVFSRYLTLFSKLTTNTSLTLLEEYGSPDTILATYKKVILNSICSTASFGLTYADHNYLTIVQTAKEAKSLGIL